MHTDLITLDIIIPVYGRPDSFDILLNDLSRSILKNNFSDVVSVIVVDDASITPIEILQDKIRITLIRNVVNRGAPLSRKKGYELSTAKFVHFHDSDDTVSEYWLTELMSMLKNKPDIDILLTARQDIDTVKNTFKLQRFYHKHIKNIGRIKKRLVYRNCMGPLGGATFSKQVLERIEFKKFASCQDWQMYLQALKYSSILESLSKSTFIFNKTGDDRISHNPRKKILGHLQLSRLTSKQSLFGRNIRLFYLYTCKKHIFSKGGLILKFYKKNRLKIFLIFLIVSLYWRLT